MKKRLYRTANEAQTLADKRGWIVQVYPCPRKAHRFHITHKEPNQ